jgi:hypothetical protein
VAIGWSCYRSEWDALGIYERKSFDALFAPVYGVSTRLFATTGSLGDTAIDGYVGKLKADDLVVGFAS